MIQVPEWFERWSGGHPWVAPSYGLEEHPTKTVYLAGPITGLTREAAKDGWRAEFSRKMPPYIQCYSPMRLVSTLQPETGLKGAPEIIGVRGMIVNRTILGRDENDLRNTDAVVANLMGAEQVSIGTVAEIGMAHILNKPIILIMEDEGNIHDHPFVTVPAMYRTADMDEAANLLIHLLTPGV